MKILIIQMARLGDTIQSLMALKAAKQLYPQAQFSMITRKKFSHAAKHVSWIDRVYEIPTDEWIGSVLNGQQKATQRVSEVAGWLEETAATQWDIVFNWSFSEASSYLASLIPATVKYGYYRRPDGAQVCADGWSYYVQGIIQSGIRQNIHLTDILTTQLLTALQIHMGDPVESNTHQPVTTRDFFTIDSKSALLAEKPMSFSRRWMGVQLGAGREDKVWEPKAWAEFVSSVLRRHSDYGVVVLGGVEDEDRCQQFMAHLSADSGVSKDDLTERVIDRVGKTDFDQWVAVVSRCHWVIAGDTAVIHLASVLGTRVLNMSIGNVRFEETGPYGNGHYVVKPNFGSISAESIYSIWSYASSEWSHQRKKTIEEHFIQHECQQRLSEAQIYRSRIRSSDDGGGVVFEDLMAGPIGIDEWFGRVLGFVARAWFCGWNPQVGHELGKHQVGSDLVRDVRAISDSCDVLVKILEEAIRTSDQLIAKASHMKSGRLMSLENRSELQTLGRKLAELDHLAERLGTLHKPYKAIIQMQKIMMHNLMGEDVQDLSKEARITYEQLLAGARILKEWIRFTLEQAKPAAVKTRVLRLVETEPKP